MRCKKPENSNKEKLKFIIIVRFLTIDCADHHLGQLNVSLPLLIVKCIVQIGEYEEKET